MGGAQNLWIAIGISIVLLVALIIGKVLGWILINIGIAALIGGGILVFLNKDGDLPDGIPVLIFGVGAIVVGTILKLIGVEPAPRSAGAEVFCSACDQFLGYQSGFDCPCPRCRSNRYYVGSR